MLSLVRRASSEASLISSALGVCEEEEDEGESGVSSVLVAGDAVGTSVAATADGADRTSLSVFLPWPGAATAGAGDGSRGCATGVIFSAPNCASRKKRRRDRRCSGVVFA